MRRVETEKEAAQVLQHAAWHCLYGSQVEDRRPDENDREAFNILVQLSQALKNGWIGK